MDRGKSYQNQIVSIHREVMRKSPKFNEETVPGNLVQYVSGDYDAVELLGGTIDGPLQVAEVDYLQGNGITDDEGNLETYSSGDRGPVFTLQSGDVIFARCTADINISEGDTVYSDGTGRVDDSDSSGNDVVGIARESLDLSTSSSAHESETDYYLMVEVS